MNLLTETINQLNHYKKTTSDVLWVGDSEVYFTWDEFAEVADVEYDSGYGSHEIFEDLVVVGNGWWLSRGEYDGSEWWDFNTPPDKPSIHLKQKSLKYEPQYNVRSWYGYGGKIRSSVVRSMFKNDNEFLAYLREVKINNITDDKKDN